MQSAQQGSRAAEFARELRALSLQLVGWLPPDHKERFSGLCDDSTLVLPRTQKLTTLSRVDTHSHFPCTDSFIKRASTYQALAMWWHSACQ